MKSVTLQSRLLRGGFWATVGRLGGIGLLLVLHIVLARSLSARDYGVYVLTHALVLVHTSVALCGLPKVVLRLIRQNQCEGQPSPIRGCIRQAFGVQVLTIAVAVALYVGLAKSPIALFRTELSHYVFWPAAWIAISAVCQLAGEVHRGYEDFRWAALLGGQNGGILANSLSLACVVGIHTWRELDLQTVFVIQVVCLAVTILLSLPAIWRRMGGVPSEAKHSLQMAPATTMADLFRQGLPILGSTLIVSSLSQLDLLILGTYSSASQAAVYGAVKRVVAVIGAPLLLANITASSFIPELYFQGRVKQLQATLREIASLSMAPSLVAFMVIAIAPGTLLRYVFGDGYELGAQPLLILAAANLVFVAAGSCNLTLDLTGHQRLTFLVSLGCGVMYCVLAPEFVARFSMTGAAVSAAAFIVTSNLLSVLFVRYSVGVWTPMFFTPTALLATFRYGLLNHAAKRISFWRTQKDDCKVMRR